MSFSTARQYGQTRGSKNPMQGVDVPASRGAAGAPSAAALPASGQGQSKANDYAALGGMGAGMLGRFLYDQSKQDLLDKQYQAANPLDEIGTAPKMTDFSTVGPDADVMGGLGTAGQGVVYDVDYADPTMMQTIKNIPSVMQGFFGFGGTGA